MGRARNEPEEQPVAEPAAGPEPEAPAPQTATSEAVEAATEKQPKPKRAASRAKAESKPAAKKTGASRRSAEHKPIVRLPKPERARGRQKERRGVVVSDAMDKTIVVRVDMSRPHPVYKKVVRRSKKFHVHDARNQAKVGDVVRIVETRPLSKTKTWRLAEIIEAAK